MKIHKSGDLFYLPDLSEVLPVRCLPVSLDATLWYEEGAMEAGSVGKDIGDGGWGGDEDGDLAQGIAVEKAVVTDALDASR